jgi:histidine triad (HIT) family protein
METLFTRMLAGAEPCVLVAEDGGHAAVMEPAPASEGHMVVFPKRPVDAFFDLDPEALSALMTFSRRIAKALETAVPCVKIAVVVYGLKVRHAHLHLIPARGGAGEIALDKPRAAADPAELERLARRIQAHL